MSNFWGAYQKYYVLTNLSTRTYDDKYVYLRKCLPRTHFGEYDVLTALALSFGGRGKAFNEFKVVRYTYYSRII